jgi:hypothetical protein
VPPATIVDKPAYSAFFRSSLVDFLFERHVTTVVVSGADSSSDAGHDALMTMYRLRFNEQIDLVSAGQLANVWRSD